MSTAPTHARQLARDWAPRLAAAGIDTARLDAELLVAHAADIERERLLIDDPELTATQLATAERLLAQRAADRTPVAQLLGERWFAGHRFAVTPDVLVPRPETELLVELAAEHAPHGARAIDVGTGSGAVAVALAAARPDLAITASDVSPAALAVARANAERLLPGRLSLQEADLLGAWEGAVVVSNPPYVEDGWRDQAQPELAHEPDLALYAGADGLDVIRRLIDQVAARPQVTLVLLEHGHQQGAAIRELLAAAGLTQVSTAQDLAGHDRVTWGQRPAAAAPAA